MKREDFPLFLTVDETANMLGVPRNNIYKKIRAGEIPVSPHGKPYRVIRDKLFEEVGVSASVGTAG